MQLALFDFDHTITVCDTYSRFLRRVATPEQRAQGWWRIGPWLLAYRLKLISAERIRHRVTSQVFTGRHAGEVTQMARDYAREHLPDMVRPEMLEQIQWHKAQGHTVAVVSASIDLYLQHWCDSLGLKMICNKLEVRDNRLTGRYAERDCGRHKVALVRGMFDLSSFQRIHAYGDSAEDKPMLALAHERWYHGKCLT